ncbi:lipocalin-15-like [Sceloporus undulatus]|uniref:lipocalin-15-like n=1 Tax=Sceloporus undulatus TaxID=8520 RepID=UPI001C4D646F|nr:lipocalin-15-like [Sceloporus undulatus]
MAVPLVSLGMALLWALCAQAKVAVQPDFDLEKFSGTWHVMAGASDCAIFQSMKDIMTTSAAIIQPLPNGDMQFQTGYPLPEECKKIEMHFKKTEQPGRFTNDEHGKKDLRVMETDYVSFAVLYVWKEAEGEPSSSTVQLLTRTPEVTPEMVERFKVHYHSVGLPDDMMVMLPKSDVCFKALSG